MADTRQSGPGKGERQPALPLPNPKRPARKLTALTRLRGTDRQER